MLQQILVKVPENQREFLLGRMTVSKSPEEILKLARENDIDLTPDEADFLFDLKDDPALEDSDLDMISGCKNPDMSLNEIPAECD